MQKIFTDLSKEFSIFYGFNKILNHCTQCISFFEQVSNTNFNRWLVSMTHQTTRERSAEKIYAAFDPSLEKVPGKYFAESSFFTQSVVGPFCNTIMLLLSPSLSRIYSGLCCKL